MAFADHLDDNNFTRVFYAFISGIPFVFSSVPLPDGWSETIGGDTYSWVNCLLTDSISSARTTSQRDSGIATGNSIRLEFELTGTQTRGGKVDPSSAAGVWHDLLISRGDRDGKFWTFLRSTLAVDGVAALVSDNSQESGTAYLGLETFEWESTGTNTLATLTRGAYGSQALRHRVAPAGIEEAGGYPKITTWPRAWIGRYVDLWIGLGKMRGGGAFTGTYSPNGSEARTDEDHLVTYVITSAPRISDDGLRVILECASLESELGRKVGKNLPNARAGLSRSQHIIVGPENSGFSPLMSLDPASSRISWGVSWYDTTGERFKNTFERLQRRDSAAATLENVPYDEKFLHWEISGFFNQTIMYGKTPDVVDGVLAVNPAWLTGALLEFERDKEKFKAKITILTSIVPGPISEVYFNTEGFLESIGFTLGTIFLESETVDGFVQYSSTATRAIPYFWIPSEGALERHLWVLDAQGTSTTKIAVNFDESPGMVDDAGNAIDGYVRISDNEVVRFDGITSAVGAQKRLDIAERLALGSRPDDSEIWVELAGEKTKVPKLVQGLAYPGCNEIRIALYSVLGGSSKSGHNHVDFDEPEWFGGNANIQASRVDVDGALALAAELGLAPTSGWFIGEPESLRDLLGEMALRGRYRWVSRDGRLSPVSIAPPLRHLRGGTLVLDASNTLILSTRVMTSESEIVNVLDARVAYDPASKKFGTEAQVRSSPSVANWGMRPSLEVDWRGEADFHRAATGLVALAQQLFVELGENVKLIEIEITRAIGWGLQFGDEVLITNAAMMGLAIPDRGVTDLLGRVLDIEHAWINNDGVCARALVLAHEGEGIEARAWAPSLYLESGSGTTWQAKGRAYSAGPADKDYLSHAVDWYGSAFQPGIESGTLNDVKIVSISGSGTVVFDTALAGMVAPVIWEPEAYDNANLVDAQRDYAYGSDGDGLLTNASGTELAHTWI